MPSVKALEEKKAIVSEIKDKAENAKTLVLFDYRGLTDSEIKDLRVKLKDNDSEYKVYKNTLLKLALKDLNIDLDSYLEGPTAIAFSKDDIAAIKVLSDASKKNSALELKAGVVEGAVADKAKLAEFASIPSREGLYTMLAGGMIQIVKDLSIALNLLSEQKEN
jgi:Ribosomal protein L10